MIPKRLGRREVSSFDDRDEAADDRKEAGDTVVLDDCLGSYASEAVGRILDRDVGNDKALEVPERPRYMY